jgi:hypothetical protein
VEIIFLCSTRHLELIIKTYLDRAYLLSPEEMLCVYGLDEDVDSYIDIKLNPYHQNPYQKNQIEERRHIFMKGYLSRNANLF